MSGNTCSIIRMLRRPSLVASSRAIATAQAIGNERLQQSAQGFAVPDSFTLGTSAQRAQWLNAGLKSGEVDSCNTFAR